MLAFEYMMELDFGEEEKTDPGSEEKMASEADGKMSPVTDGKMASGSDVKMALEPDGRMAQDSGMEMTQERSGGLAGLAREHAFTLRCLPQENVSQHVRDCEIRVEPDVPLSYGTDAFGTGYCYGLIHELHSRFRVRIRGEAERYPERHEEAPPFTQPVYRLQTSVTDPGPALRKMAAEEKAAEERAAGSGENDRSSLQRALRIRDLVFRTMTYTPGATAPFTTAEEAAESGRGVCQDYAHIMLALCRMEGIPCRYTAGLLLGEGTSHAWVEICSHGNWIPMDPTNPDVAWNAQLVFSHGRDARDCEINRGVYLGPHSQTQKIAARLRVV